MTELDPDLIVPCGVLTATTSNSSDLGVAARLSDQHGADISVLTSGETHARFPMAASDFGEAALSQPDAGHFSPPALRRTLPPVGALLWNYGHSRDRSNPPCLRYGVEAGLEDDRQVRAGAAIVANGAFAAGSQMLLRPVVLRAKSEIYVMAEVDEQQAAELAGMPCIKRTIEHPELADLYVIPPIRYPDGHFYIKAGATLPAILMGNRMNQ
jgi:sarcosine oxidase